MKRMRKCNDEVYQLAKNQALVKKIKKNKRFRRLFIIFVCLHRIVSTCFRSDIP